MALQRAARLGGEPSTSWIEKQLPKTGVPVIAASDYVSAVGDLIRPWVRDPFTVLGTDGFGRSDTRAKLRRFFEVDRHSIVVASLSAAGSSRVGEAIKRFGIDPGSQPSWRR
jgi:pyruvate dehydrogenase E1 component